jgi:hypothetical protein
MAGSLQPPDRTRAAEPARSAPCGVRKRIRLHARSDDAGRCTKTWSSVVVPSVEGKYYGLQGGALYNVDPRRLLSENSARSRTGLRSRRAARTAACGPMAASGACMTAGRRRKSGRRRMDEHHGGQQLRVRARRQRRSLVLGSNAVAMASSRAPGTSLQPLAKRRFIDPPSPRPARWSQFGTDWRCRRDHRAARGFRRMQTVRCSPRRDQKTTRRIRFRFTWFREHGPFDAQTWLGSGHCAACSARCQRFARGRPREGFLARWFVQAARRGRKFRVIRACACSSPISPTRSSSTV